MTHTRLTSGSEQNANLAAVREYWNNHIHDWKVARSEPGTAAFFEEIEAYRFEKLEYLAQVVDFFNGYAGKSVLDVGCGVGNDLSRFCRGGAIVTGIDLAPHSIELARSNFVVTRLCRNTQLIKLLFKIMHINLNSFFYSSKILIVKFLAFCRRRAQKGSAC